MGSTLNKVSLKLFIKKTEKHKNRLSLNLYSTTYGKLNYHIIFHSNISDLILNKYIQNYVHYKKKNKV